VNNLFIIVYMWYCIFA